MHVQADAFHAVLSAWQMQSHSQYYLDCFVAEHIVVRQGSQTVKQDVVAMQHADALLYTGKGPPCCGK